MLLHNNSLLSEFDDYVTNSKVSKSKFETGDLVWGKVKSHPWWPGHILNESFLSPTVRNLKIPGYVLVSFFGDNSYNWLHPSQLLPFEPHLNEKSKQTKCVTFVKAIEEALDEISKRTSLGLTCKCFGNVKGGCFVVDEVERVCSSKDIKKVRDGFSCLDTVAFVRRCGVWEFGYDSVEFVKKKAAVLAFRKAVFEEFDETYEQAFKVKSAYGFVKKVQEPFTKALPLSRALLSGSLVTADTLEDLKRYGTAMQVKGSTKQDKCLPKGRGEAGDRTVEFGQVQASSQLQGNNGSSAGGDNVLPRTQYLQTHMKDEQAGFNRALPSSRALLSGSLVTAETLEDLKSYGTAMKVDEATKQEEAGDMRVALGHVQASSQLHGINGSSAGGEHVLSRTQYLQTSLKDEQDGFACMDLSGDILGKKSIVSKLSRFDDKGLAQESNVRKGEKGVLFPGHVKYEARTSLKQDKSGTYFRSNEGSRQGKSAAGVGIKKVNVLKRSSGEMNYANGPKKKMKEPKSELNSSNPDKRKPSMFAEAGAKKASQLDAAERHSNMGNSKHDVPQLLSSMQSLSLDSYFGSSDKSSIKAVRRFFLRFRSFAYHKHSLANSSSTTKLSKSADNLSSINQPSKPERKRLSSDHQQDIPSTKKLKKTIQIIKPMSSANKTNQEPKKSSNLAPITLVRNQVGPGPVPINAKAQPRKKMSPSKKVTEPTMLVMKFPFGTSLPSTALLKARFGRFGPLDQSAIRVFWKSSICRVVFQYKLDAQTALRYASGSNSLFGNLNVTYFLRDMKSYSAPGDHEPKKAKTDKPMVEPPSRHQPNIQLKSCLKTRGSKGTGNRVRFMLGGKETETTIRVSGRNNGSSSSCVAMEFVSKNTQNIVPSTLPQFLPLSSHNSKNQVDQVEQPADQLKCTVDISEEMMKLLLRCNDVLANYEGLLGNVPYHHLL